MNEPTKPDEIVRVAKEFAATRFADGVRDQIHVRNVAEFSFMMGAEHERERHRWIPVGDRLPEEKDRVLITSHTTEIVCSAYYYDDTASGEPQWNLLGGGVLDFDCVTHWMPLPAKPEVES